jgi:hypothetical protein
MNGQKGAEIHLGIMKVPFPHITGYCSRHGHLYILVNSFVIKAKINSAMRHLFIIYFYLFKRMCNILLKDGNVCVIL